MQANRNRGLLKVLGPWDSVAIVIGIVIGVGIFRVPAEVAKHLVSPELIILAWLFGGAISLMGASCYAELASSFPETGGDYVYLKESYGPLVGFLYGWTGLLVVRTGVVAAMSFIFAEYLCSLLSLGSSFVKLIAISVVLILSLVNIIGLRHAKWLQNISVIAKVACLVGLILFGVLSRKGEVSNFQPSPVHLGMGILPRFGLALIPVLWTYGGWHENTFLTGETKDAQRTLPMALMTGTLIITALYICMNLVYIYLIPADRMAGASLRVSDAMRVLYGMRATKIVEALVVISAFGGINGTIMTSCRITYALGRDNSVFRYLGKVDERFSTPSRSIIINALWTILLILLGTFDRLLFFTGIVVWLFFAAIVAGIFILRHKYPQKNRPYRVWGYPVVPTFFVLVCIGLVINTIAYYPFQSLIGLCLTLIGVPVYLISKRLG